MNKKSKGRCVMFETTGIVDELGLKNIRKYMILPRQRTLILSFMIKDRPNKNQMVGW